MEVNHKQLRTILSQCWKVKQPLFIWGAIGIGKSMAAKEFFADEAKKQGREFAEWVYADEAKKKDIADNLEKYLVFVDERVALKDSTDNKGIPAMGEKYLRWVKTQIMNLSTHPDSMVVWFKDELNLAPPSVQASEYQIVLDRALDDLSFSKNTFVFAAGNRQEDLSNVFEMSAALKNRFAHVTLKASDADRWVEWAMEHKLDSRIVTFVQFKPQFLFKMPAANSKDNAFPTHRSWHKASEMIKGVNEIDHLKMFVASNVGDAVGIEFAAWYKLNQKVDLNAILEHPEKIKNHQEISMATSIIAGIVDKYTNNNDLLEKAVGVAINTRQELAVHMLRLVKSVSPNFFLANVPKTKYFQTIMDEYKKYLN